MGHKVLSFELLALFFVAVSLCFPASGQEKSPGAAQRIQFEPCVVHNRTMDEIAISAEEGTVIIAISHVGIGEDSKVIGERRLHNIRTYLQSVNGRQVIAAHGAKAGSNGTVDVYTNGRLFCTFVLRRNTDLLTWCVDDGEGNSEYYPWKSGGKGVRP